MRKTLLVALFLVCASFAGCLGDDSSPGEIASSDGNASAGDEETSGPDSDGAPSNDSGETEVQTQEGSETMEGPMACNQTPSGQGYANWDTGFSVPKDASDEILWVNVTVSWGPATNPTELVLFVTDEEDSDLGAEASGTSPIEAEFDLSDNTLQGSVWFGLGCTEQGATVADEITVDWTIVKRVPVEA